MTKLVATLVERGHVHRAADPHDARASTISITDEGRTAYHGWRAAVATALAPYFADLSPADLDALRRSVRLLQERIELGESETRTKHHDADLEVSTK
jgi:DNA-binding MarR family transcriptional regulator